MFTKIFLLFSLYSSYVIHSSAFINKNHKITVPHHETIRVKTTNSYYRHKREVRPVEFEKEDGTKVVLHLTPIEENVVYQPIPAWTVESTQDKPHKHQYKEIDSSDTLIDGTFYEDPDKMATMIAYYKDKYIFYDGIFGEQKSAKVIKSWKESYMHGYEPVNDTHIIYNVKKDLIKPVLNNVENIDPREKLSEQVDVFYVKLLVVVEYSHFEALGEDISETVKYVATFWNAVNLKYRKLTNPQVKIMITGIIIAKDYEALEYIVGSRYPDKKTEINPDKLNDLGGIYFANGFKDELKFRNYDSVVTMSNLWTGGIGGAAFVGRMCSEDRNIAFVYDDGNFAGIKSGTHEIGHLLGLPHDGYQDAAECKSCLEDEVCTIMSPFSDWVERVVWSECSKKLLNKFSWTRDAECLKDRNHA